MNPERYQATIFGMVRRTIGKYGYFAYFPQRVPRSVEISMPSVTLLADAEAALGRLAGAGRLLPNPHFVSRPYLLREAVASARIEGTRTDMRVARPTALRLLGQLAELGIVSDSPVGPRRQRRWIAREVLDAQTKPLA